ncbi:MAG: hypothetical protein DMG05_20885 [Acidobacteria bacterium]|nr:MAG: hypothetical protein DMG05_20885 [Acidobacteriota bacterium]
MHPEKNFIIKRRPRAGDRNTLDIFYFPKGINNPAQGSGFAANPLKFGHFHCRLAASEDRPAFQGRSRQPNPITRRGATDEKANPNRVRDSSAADAARVPYGCTKVRALKEIEGLRGSRYMPHVQTPQG